MPHKNLSDLPDSVRTNLPKHAQEIYRAAYNSAWDNTIAFPLRVATKSIAECACQSVKLKRRALPTRCYLLQGPGRAPR